MLGCVPKLSRVNSVFTAVTEIRGQRGIERPDRDSALSCSSDELGFNPGSKRFLRRDYAQADFLGRQDDDRK